MKNLFTLFLIITASAVFSQQNDSVQKPKWTIGLGTNFIDNSGTVDNQFFNSSRQWNFLPAVSLFSVERSVSDKFSVSTVIGMNVISANKLQNGIATPEDVNYYGLDLNGKFFFDDFIVPQSIIDSYVVLGLGINSTGDVSNQSGNFGLGLNFWFQPNLGLRVQTVGKYGFDQDTLLNNHIQHSAELILKF